MTRIEALQIALDTMYNANGGDELLDQAMDVIVHMINTIHRQNRKNKKYTDLHRQIYT